MDQQCHSMQVIDGHIGDGETDIQCFIEESGAIKAAWLDSGHYRNGPNSSGKDMLRHPCACTLADVNGPKLDQITSAKRINIAIEIDPRSDILRENHAAVQFAGERSLSEQHLIKQNGLITRGISAVHI